MYNSVAAETNKIADFSDYPLLWAVYVHSSL